MHLESDCTSKSLVEMRSCVQMCDSLNYPHKSFAKIGKGTSVSLITKPNLPHGALFLALDWS